MNLADFIKGYINGLLDFYRDYFKKTFETAFNISLFTVIGAGLFLLQAPDSIFEHIRKYSFISLFNGAAAVSYTGYHLIDLYRQLFLILATLFAIGFKRSLASGKFRFSGIISNITISDAGNILIASVAIIATDVLLYYLQYSFIYKNAYPLYSFLGFFRVRLPFIYLTVAFYFCEYHPGFKITLRSLIYIFVVSFIINTVVLKIQDLIVVMLEFPFIMIPQEDIRLLVEIIASIPVLALYLLGYSYTISYPAEYFHNHSAKKNDEEEPGHLLD